MGSEPLPLCSRCSRPIAEVAQYCGSCGKKIREQSEIDPEIFAQYRAQIRSILEELAAQPRETGQPEISAQDLAVCGHWYHLIQLTAGTGQRHCLDCGAAIGQKRVSSKPAAVPA